MTSINLPQKSIFIPKKCILTEREVEYLSLASFGFKNREIAKILSVSISAVKKAFEVIFQKIHAKDRAHAVAIGFIHQIINSEVLTFVSQKYNIANIEKLD